MIRVWLTSRLLINSNAHAGDTGSANDLEQLSIKLYGMRKHSELLAERGLDAHIWFMEGVKEGTAFAKKELGMVTSTKDRLPTAETPVDARLEALIAQKRPVES